MTKQDVQNWLFENARMPAHLFEKYLWGWTNLVPGKRTLNDWVRLGKIPKVFAGNDPNRLVPVVTKPEHIMIAVSGDPLRSNCYLFVHNGMLGFPTTRSVKLPKGWRTKLVRRARLSRGGMTDDGSLWIVLPTGQQASGGWIDDTLKQRAAEQGMSSQGAARRRLSAPAHRGRARTARRGSPAGALPAARLERRPAGGAAHRGAGEGGARLHRPRARPRCWARSSR